MPSTLCRPRPVALATLLLTACGSPLDPNDCLWAPSGRCEPFLTEGTLCGLQHTEFFGLGKVPGSECVVEGETAPLASAARGAPACPTGFRLAELVSDDESEGNGYLSCVALDNLASSSGRLADVPRNSACGLNTVGDRQRTRNLCMGLDPAIDGCPGGYTLRFGLDLSRDCQYDAERIGQGVDVTRGVPSFPNSFVGSSRSCVEDEDMVNSSHLLYWCELTEDGCVGEDCRPDLTPVCGLTPAPTNSLFHASSLVVAEVRAESELLYDEMRAAEEALYAESPDDSELTHTCAAETLRWDECPVGWELACTPDCRGLNDWQRSPDTALCGAPYNRQLNGGWCWCARPGTGNDFGLDELLTDSGGGDRVGFEHL